jgi:hypothetical protein
MYELISIPKRNTTAAGVTHFMCKFLVLISHHGTSHRPSGRSSFNLSLVSWLARLAGPGDG